MKKLLYVFVAILSIVLIVGCGEKNKEVNCTINLDTGDLKQSVEVHAEWNGKKLDNIIAKMKFKASDDTTIEHWNYFTENLTKQLNQTYVESKGIKFDSKIDNENYEYTYTMSIDLNKSTNEGLEKLGLGNVKGSDTSYETFIKDFEEQDYTCK